MIKLINRDLRGCWCCKYFDNLNCKCTNKIGCSMGDGFSPSEIYERHGWDYNVTSCSNCKYRYCDSENNERCEKMNNSIISTDGFCTFGEEMVVNDGEIKWVKSTF